MPKRLINHDTFFRGAFSMRSIVLIYIRKFIAADIRRHLDLDTLQKADDSFVSGRLLSSFSDVVWTCCLTDGRLLRICFIFEHKSKQPKVPIFVQLLQYMVNIWRSDLRHKRPLTLPIPIVIHHGKEKWETRPFHTYFEGITDSLCKFVPTFEYVLTDLEQITAEQLKAKRLEQLFHVFLAMKSVFHTPEFLLNMRTVLNFAGDYFESEEGLELFEMVMTYFQHYAPLPPAEVIEIIEQLKPKPRTMARSAYQNILAEGRREGRLEGKLEGEALKEAEKDREFVTSLIHNTDWDDARIAYIANVPEVFVLQVREELAKLAAQNN